MPEWIALVNSLAAAASIGFAVAALIAPARLVPGVENGTGTRFYAAAYAGRAIPLGLAVAVAVWLAPSGPGLLLLLGAALLAQLADVLIGAVHRTPGMVAGAAFAAACHGAALWALL